MRVFRTLLVGLIVVAALTGCTRRHPGAEEPAYVEVVVGDPAPGQRVPLIFGIHGLGDTPEMFARLFASEFPIAARLVFPRGISPEGQGFSWFPIPASAPLDGDATAEGVRAAGERIAVLVERLRREYEPAVKPVVFGYSQGGMLSFYLAARHPDLVAAVVPLSGFLPPSLLGKSVPAPTYAFHGAADELVPVASARATIRAFAERGGTATLTEFPHVGHLVNVAVVRALQQKVAELAAPAS